MDRAWLEVWEALELLRRGGISIHLGTRVTLRQKSPDGGVIYLLVERPEVARLVVHDIAVPGEP